MVCNCKLFLILLWIWNLIKICMMVMVIHEFCLGILELCVRMKYANHICPFKLNHPYNKTTANQLFQHILAQKQHMSTLKRQGKL